LIFCYGIIISIIIIVIIIIVVVVVVVIIKDKNTLKLLCSFKKIQEHFTAKTTINDSVIL